ncbi:MBL fold metallo-hydrolase [candidate division WOR-3 bacterium]|nr:MBL fold metallo-hydrolase [candidate division WOR-3 bacterium]
MNTKRFIVGEIQTNCYFVEDHRELAVIDPGGYSEEMLGFREDYVCKYIILTHNHYDHIAAVPELKRLFPEARIAIHEKDAQNLNDPMINGSFLFGMKIQEIYPDVILNKDDKIILGTSEFRVLHTPGHTEGSISLTAGDTLFSGDTLFRGGIGRCDLPCGDFNKIKKSLRSLFDLKSNFKVLPGHGEETKLYREKKYIFSL